MRLFGRSREAICEKAYKPGWRQSSRAQKMVCEIALRVYGVKAARPERWSEREQQAADLS